MGKIEAEIESKNEVIKEMMEESERTREEYCEAIEDY